MKDYEKIAKINAATRQAAKERRAVLLQKAQVLGVRTVHIFDDNTSGGLTIAFARSSAYASGTMVDVAVATCSLQDCFCRSTGTTLALEKFFLGETIQLPLLRYYDEESLPNVVKRAFSALLYQI